MGGDRVGTCPQKDPIRVKFNIVTPTDLSIFSFQCYFVGFCVFHGQFICVSVNKILIRMRIVNWMRRIFDQQENQICRL